MSTDNYTGTQTMSKNKTLKQHIINQIIGVEGGYVNDPSDSGGETNWGITIAVARAYGYKGKMIDLPRNIAFKIYSTKYWDINRLDDIAAMSEMIAEELADTGVNMGVRRAGRFLQRSLNALNDRGNVYDDIVVDGLIGNGTIKALEFYIRARKEVGLLVLFRMLNALQGARYVELAERREKDERFIYGWFKHRVG